MSVKSDFMRGVYVDMSCFKGKVINDVINKTYMANVTTSAFSRIFEA